MSFRKYARLSLPEAVFCFLACTALCICVLDGFDWPEALSEAFLPVLLLCGAITALGYAFSFRRKTIVLGVLLLCAFSAGGIAVLSAGGTAAYGLFYAVICLTAICVFLLSRTRIGSVVLCAGGVLLIAGSAFLEFGSRPGCLAVFLIAGACLLVSRQYRVSMLRFSTHTPETAKMAALALVLCVLSAALSAGTYFAVIRPLAPQTQELKLVTELKKLPLLEKLGVSSTIHIMDHDRYTAALEEEKLISDTQGEQEPDAPDSKEEQSDIPESLPAAVDTPAEASAVSYEFKFYTGLYLAAGAAVLLLAVIAGKLLHRRLRLSRLLKKSPEAQIREMYLYFIRLMTRCGLPPLAADTPLEYCSRVARRSDRFFSEQGAFRGMTLVFERVCYGAEPPSQAEHDQFLRAYREFPAKCSKSVNLFKRVPIFFVS